MFRESFVGLVFVVVCLVTSSFAQLENLEESEDGQSGTIKFETPSLDSEDSHSPWVPDNMKCDSCIAVAFQLWKKFDTYNKKRPSLKYKISESDVIELTEEVCLNGKLWEGYGVKKVKNEKRLSGPGLDVEEVPGVTAGGMQWPNRLKDMCESMMGSEGEMFIYNGYRKNPNSQKKFDQFLCYGTGVLSSCITKNSKTEL